MKKTWNFFIFANMTSIIWGEFIFNKVYLNPIETINLCILSIPVFNISISFVLKFFAFDLLMWSTAKNLFIKRKLYGFPYPKNIRPFFAVITIFNIILVISNYIYAIFCSVGFERCICIARSGVLYLINNPLGPILKFFVHVDYSAFLPLIPSIILFAVTLVYALLSEKNVASNEKIFWIRELILPGETRYRNENNFHDRYVNVFVCYFVIYRFIVLMNIRLSYRELTIILLGFIVLFFLFEYASYDEQISQDKNYYYEKIAGQLNFMDGIHWKDLLDFQMSELQKLKVTEESYKHSKIRNIRWLELYEHMVINDTKSIYDTIANWENGIYSIQKTTEEIKQRISSIEKISTSCMPILPNSVTFNPKKVDIIAYLKKEINLAGDEFLDKELIGSYYGFADVTILSSVLQIMKEYISSFSATPIVCRSMMDNAGWLNIEFASAIIDRSILNRIKKDINRVNDFWEESKTIDYYNFPIELAVAQSYMKDIDGDMTMILENHQLKFVLSFPAISAFRNDPDELKKNHRVDIGRFLEEYTIRNEFFTPFHNSHNLYISADEQILREIMEHFTQYSYPRMKKNNSVFITVKKMDGMICVLLKFKCALYYSALEKEVQETLHYWRIRKELAPEHSSLSLLMIKNKMEQLSGSVDLSLEEGYFKCELLFVNHNTD